MENRDVVPASAPQPTGAAVLGSDGGAAYDRDAIFALGRPDRRLLTYYALASLLAGPLFPLFLLPLYLRFRTLRYRFDEEGIGMRWGALRRREVDLAYVRIQDIHMISNAVERWLGLARIKVQTASGSQKAEVTIEGFQEYEALRSYLVDRMRRARRTGLGESNADRSARPRVEALDTEALEAICTSLESATSELRALREIFAPDGVASDREVIERRSREHG